jgi:hypothetical protein
MSWIAAGIAGGTALLKFGEGEIQKGQANKIDKNNPYPNYPVPTEYTQNVNQAQAMSQEGIPLASYNQQQTAIGANQAAGLHAQGQSANPTGVAGIVRQGDQATGQLNAQDAIQRNRNLLTLLQERQTLAQQKDKAWDWNSQQKYLSNLAKSQALKTSGNQSISSGISDVGSAGLMGAKLGVFGGSAKTDMGANIGQGTDE